MKVHRLLPISALAVLTVLVTAPVDLSSASQAVISRPRFPSPRRDELLNGLHIAVVHRPTSRAVVINLTIIGGATYDLAGKAGLASVTAEMLLRGGTEGLAPKQIEQIIETDAPSFQITANWDSISVTATSQPERADLVLDLIGRLIAFPKFGAAELEAVKKARLQKMQAILSDPAREAADTFDSALYGGYPYGHTIDGTVNSIKSINRADLFNFHKRFALANNAVLVLVGNLAFDDAMQAARSGLGRLLKGTIAPATFRPLPSRAASSVLVLDRKTRGDSYLHLGHFGVSRTFQDYYAVLVLNHLLGEGAQSRLVRRVSVEKNYTQLISSRFEARSLGGPFVVTTVAPSATLPRIVQETLQVMEKLRSDLVSDSELATAKQRIIDDYPLQFETDAQIAGRLAEIEVYDLGRDYIVAFQDRVARVTAEQVRDVARKVLSPDKVLIVAAGPAGELKESLSQFGSVAVEPPLTPPVNATKPQNQ